MRYKVSYGKHARTNRWGHFLPEDQQPPRYEEWFSSLTEAMAFAANIAQTHKKRYYANIFDYSGPEDEFNNTTWCVGGWDKGVYYPNDAYLSAIK